MQLVLNTFGASLRRKGERFLVRSGGQEVALSAHKVHSILVAEGVSLTSAAIRLAAEHNIDIAFLDRRGDPYGRLWPCKLGGTALTRRRQLEAADGPEGLEVARAWAAAKVRHQREFLAELAARRPESGAELQPALDTLAACLAKIEAVAGTVEERRGTLMGLEGTAGRAYFRAVSGLMPEGYRFDGRSRRPAKDAFNAALNYAYGALYAHCDRAAVVAGLDPFVGFLHADDYGRRSLVYDLIEPFRVIADRAVVLLFTGRRARADYFEPVPGGVCLTKDGRAAVLTALNERLEKRVRYPVQGGGRSRNVRRRDVIGMEAHALANRLLGRADIPEVVEAKDLFAEAGREGGADADVGGV